MEPIRRRDFLRGCAAGAAGLAAALQTRRTPAAAKPTRKPNIIFIMADDLGYGDLGCYGQKRIKTPHLDRMAEEGTRFTQCYVGSPVCGPARCTLMTGLHSGHCTRRGNRAKANPPGAGKDRGLVPLRADDVTVAAVLRKAGYATGGFGKWGLGNPGTTGVPEKHGFDEFFGYYDQVHAHNYYTTYLLRNSRRVPLKGNEGSRKEQYTHNVIAAESLKFIRKHKDRPFFLYLPYTPPHGKYVVPSDAPYTREPWPQQQKNYAAMITLLDGTCGQVLALLKELGLDEHTIVFFTSDNGPNPPFLKLFHSAGGLRGLKRSLYEGGIRVPMVVRWPGKVPARRTSDFVWTHVDFLPTAAALAGIEPPPPPPENLDGMSVLPALLGKAQPPHKMLYWEFHSPFHQAVRMGRWKGVRFGTEEPLALYDLAKDPAEKSDLAADHADIVKKMESCLAAARTDSKYWPARPRGRKRRTGRNKQPGKKG